MPLTTGQRGGPRAGSASWRHLVSPRPPGLCGGPCSCGSHSRPQADLSEARHSLRRPSSRRQAGGAAFLDGPSDLGGRKGIFLIAWLGQGSRDPFKVCHTRHAQTESCIFRE